VVYCREVPSVHVVVVAYNRRDLLASSLTAVLGQTRPPDQVHVVDNASTDGTPAMVGDRFPAVTLHVLPANTGGAGGFASGLAFALAAGADLVWLMDDDTVPEPGALAALLAARESYAGPPPGVVASRVVWTDGRDHPMNTPRARPGATAADRAAAVAAGCLPVRSASFVSLLVDADAVRVSGLPEADFFLWNDDFEFTTRLLRHRPGLYCPASVVEHRTRTFGSTDADPGERFYFEVRNKVWTFLRSEGLSVPEKLLYGGSTLRRWVRTFVASDDRPVLARGLRRGLADGLRSRPRPPGEVLAEVGVDLPHVDAPRTEETPPGSR
jgi:rhamnopyranosyl-N-acetylglucosaminyl-diphospho-decaprenol beta-1,3/1,4-galactofuranosyltransferase